MSFFYSCLTIPVRPPHVHSIALLLPGPGGCCCLPRSPSSQFMPLLPLRAMPSSESRPLQRAAPSCLVGSGRCLLPLFSCRLAGLLTRTTRSSSVFTLNVGPHLRRALPRSLTCPASSCPRSPYRSPLFAASSNDRTSQILFHLVHDLKSRLSKDKAIRWVPSAALQQLYRPMEMSASSLLFPRTSAPSWEQGSP